MTCVIGTASRTLMEYPILCITWCGQSAPIGALATSDVVSSDGGITLTCGSPPDVTGTITGGEMIIGWMTTDNADNATLNVGGRGSETGSVRPSTLWIQ